MRRAAADWRMIDEGGALVAQCMTVKRLCTASVQ